MDKACFLISMKLLLLTAALLIIGCKSDPPPPPEEPKPDPEAQLEAVKAFMAEQVKLLNRKHTLNKKLTQIISKKQDTELSDWHRILGTARSAQRDSEIQQANENIIALNSKIHNLSKELPAIREAQDRLDRWDKELTALRRSFAEKTPEGQAIIKELNEIEEELKAKQ